MNNQLINPFVKTHKNKKVQFKALFYGYTKRVLILSVGMLVLMADKSKMLVGTKATRNSVSFEGYSVEPSNRVHGRGNTNIAHRNFYHTPEALKWLQDIIRHGGKTQLKYL